MANFSVFYPPSGGGSSANASVGLNGVTAPTSSTEVAGVNPSGNLQPLQTDASGNLLTLTTPATGSVQHVIVDSSALPTGAATQATLATVSTTLGSILLDMTNGTQITQVSNFPATQPVSGTVTVTQATGTNLHTVVDAQVLPTGAATETTLAAINTKTPALGQALAAASSPVVLTALQLTALTPLTAAQANQGTANTVANGWPVKITDGTSTAAVKAASTAAVAADPAQVVALSPNNNTLANALFVKNTDGTNTGAVKAASTAAVAADPALVVALSPNNNTLANAIFMKNSDGTNTAAVKAASTAALTTDPALVIALSPNSNIVAEVSSTTSAVTSVAGSATTVSLLALNTARKNAVFFNESTAILYLKLGATASTTSYTVQVPPGGYFELPLIKIYTGAIDGIWSAANGSVRITELT